MQAQPWRSIAQPASEAAARILLGLLQSESIPARIASNVPVPGLEIAFRVEVPEAFEQRAMDLVRRNQVSEEELATLALNTKGDESN